MAHSYRRASYGGGNSSAYQPHHHNHHRNGGYSTGGSGGPRHYRGAGGDVDDYYYTQPVAPRHHYGSSHHQQHQNRRSERYDRHNHDGGYTTSASTHHNGAMFEEHHQQQPRHHHRQHYNHHQQQPHHLQTDTGDAPETPSIMHVGMKIPLTEFFPGSNDGVVSYSPDSEIPVDENEPIEAGRLPKAKNRSRSESVTSNASARRSELVAEESSNVEGDEEEGEDAARHKRKEEAYKTALCDAYRKNSECSYGKQCRFAHGEHELRLPPQPRGKAHPKYKTQLCDKFSVQGYCPYGPRCQFIHMMKKGLPLVEYEKKVRAGKISPTRECVEFIDEDDMESSYTKNNGRPYTIYQVDPRRYSSKGNGGHKESRRRSYQDDYVPRRYEKEYDHHLPQHQHQQGGERIYRQRSLEVLNADAPRVTYEKIPTTPKRAPHRPKELSLIHEETEEHESPPSAKMTRPPAWVTQLMMGGAALAPLAAAPSPRPGRAPKMDQIEEHEECDYHEEYRKPTPGEAEVLRRSTRA